MPKDKRQVFATKYMTGIQWKTVGVIGGFGPEATVDFYQRVLDYSKKRVTGARANTGYPRMVIYNCNFIPFGTNGRTAKRANPELLHVTKKLEEAGANFIVMPSNTPHLFYNEIASSVSIPVLNIIEETAKAVRDSKIKKAGVISAHPEVGELYGKYLRRYNIETENPSASLYRTLTKMIEEFMAGRNRGSAKRFFMELMGTFDKKAEVTILARTELPLILGADLNTYRFIDSAEVLANVTVEYALAK